MAQDSLVEEGSSPSSPVNESGSSSTSNDTSNINGTFSWEDYFDDGSWNVKLLDSRITIRMVVLNELLEKLQVQPLPSLYLGTVVNSLFLTVPRYSDANSQLAVQAILKRLHVQFSESNNSIDIPFVKGVVKGLEAQIKAGASLPPSILYGFSSFASTLIATCLPYLETNADLASSFAWKSLCNVQATCFDLLYSSQHRTGKACSSKALSFFRRVITNANSLPSVEAWFDSIISNKDIIEEKDTAKYSLIIGVLIGFLSKSKSTAFTAEKVSTLVKFYNKVMLAAKSMYNEHYLSVFDKSGIWEMVPSAEADAIFGKEIFPAMDRLLLRSPEVALSILLSLIPNLPFDQVISNWFAMEKGADGIMGAMKSSNEVVRNIAIQVWGVVCSRVLVDGPGGKKVVDSVVKQLNAKITSIESRVLVYSTLAHLPVSSQQTSEHVIKSFTPFLSKEPIDQAIMTILKSITTHAESSPATFLELVVGEAASGNNVKPLVRRSALVALTQSPKLFSSLKESSKVVATLIKELPVVIGKAQTAGVSLGNNPTAVGEAFAALTTLVKISLFKTDDESFTESIHKLLTPTITTSKKEFQQSFWANDKIYTKVSASGDDLVAIQGFLETMILQGAELTKDIDSFDNVLACLVGFLAVQADHGQTRKAFLDTITSFANVSRELETRMVGLLKRGVELSTSTPATNETISAPLTSSSTAADNGSNTSLSEGTDASPLTWSNLGVRSSKTLGPRIYEAVRCLANGLGSLPDSPHKIGYANDFLLILSDPMVMKYFKYHPWETFTEIAGVSADAIDLERVLSSTISSPAQFEALKLIVGIKPNPGIKRIGALGLATLESAATKIAHLSQEDVDIWKTPATELYHDPTQDKHKKDADSHRPRNETEKWEAELRKELANKKGANSKRPGSAAPLSKEAKEAIAAQFVKEAEIRSKVDAIHTESISGLNILDSVVSGIQSILSVTAIPMERKTELVHYFGKLVRKMVRVLLEKVIIPQMSLVALDDVSSSSDGQVNLVGKEAVKLFSKIGSTIVAFEVRRSSILAENARFGVLGATVLKTWGVEDIEEDDHIIDDDDTPAQETPLETHLTRVMKLIQDAVSTSLTKPPLSPVAFTYLFPVFYAAIQRSGAIKSLAKKHQTELRLLAANIILPLSTSLAAFGDIVQLKGILQCIVTLLESLHLVRADARKALIGFCEVVGETKGSDNQDEVTEEEPGNESAAVINTLLNGLLSGEMCVREACLCGLEYLDIPGSCSSQFDIGVWVSRFDVDESVSAKAQELWADWHGPEGIATEQISGIVDKVTLSVSDVSTSAGKSLCAALQLHSTHIKQTLDQVYEVYRIKALPLDPEYDEYGMVIPGTVDRADPWESRVGIANALKSCSEVITDAAIIEEFFNFLIDQEALGDRNETVRAVMLSAALAIINSNGKSHVKLLMNTFDSYLSKPAHPSDTHDRIRESIVVCLGTLAQHLETDNPTIPKVVSKLIETLKTPSETVQMAVSECLPPLIKMIKDDVPKLVEQLLNQLFNSPKFGERRGAAYGIAGVVKGHGISALKEFNIMQSLKDAAEDKKKYERREGAMSAFEILSLALGRLFEPYVIQILPLLLACFGDANKDVRMATEDASRVIMSKLSGHCVKLLLPSLLTGLEDRSWRTKSGSVELLGSMAYLAPKQLSMSLPTVVPKICEVLADPHHKVQEAATQSLRNFGNVIKNPEIQVIVPMLVGGLLDPNNKTQLALTSLLDTSFVHYIDAASLALVIPILHRGLRERLTDTKKKAAQIMGNMATLTEQKDLVPYLSILLPDIKEVLVDPVPETRAIAARALGTMVSKLGEENFPGIVTELFQTLKSDTGSVDRSGAAQGLAEILAGIGLSRLEGLMPEIIANTGSSKAYVREGFMMLLVFLPLTFRDSFQQFLSTGIPAILRGLADESDGVRDAALKAGKMVVQFFANTAVDLLLPELEKGLFDDNWRIRQSSVQLMGDLLYRITGISSKVVDDLDEDVGAGTESGRQILIEILGIQRYHSVLSSLYIVRSDVSGIVRQASLHVWKSIVTNTPRALREIMPVMMDMLINALASESYEKRQVAGRTLGDLVRKLGESMLDDIVPIFEKGLESEDGNVRQGVCIGMSEVMSSGGKGLLEELVEPMIPLIKKGLIDSEPEVREAAAMAFDNLHQHIGSRAIDELVPALLAALKTSDESSDFALEALKEMMAVRSNVVFPVLIPTLLAKPITAFNARALGTLMAVAGGPSLNRRLPVILPSLMDGLMQEDDAVEDIKEAIQNAIVNIDDVEGLRALMEILFEIAKEQQSSLDTDSGKVKAICIVVAIFAENAQVEFSTYVSDWFDFFLYLFRHEDTEVVKAAWEAFDKLTKSIKKDDLDSYVRPLRRSMRRNADGLKPKDTISGYCLPKGIAPLLPIFLQGLMYSSPEIREESANGLTELIYRTSPDSLKSFVTQITGPLIRIIGDRFPPQVKAAMLETLSALLSKVPAMLKPFLPQLQRTFIKSLSETTIPVREQARECLAILIPLQARLDPLATELITGVKTAEDKGIKESMFGALASLLSTLGTGREINEANRKAILDLILEGVYQSGENDDGVRASAAKSFAAYLATASSEEASSLVNGKVLAVPDSWPTKHGVALTIYETLNVSSSLFNQLNVSQQVVETLASIAREDKVSVLEAVAQACGKFLLIQEYSSVLVSIVPILSDLMVGEKASEVKRETLVAIKRAAKQNHAGIQKHAAKLIPSMLQCARDRNVPVKLAAERALYYLLDVANGNDFLTEVSSQLDSNPSRLINEYVKKVLTKFVGEGDSGDD